MGSWSPVILGNAFIVLVIAGAAVAPNSWWARELRRGYGVRPTGEDGGYTRRDHFRAALFAFVGGVVLIAVGFAVAIAGDRYPNVSTASYIAMVYMFGCILLGGVALLSSMIAAWDGLRWRPPTSPDASRHRLSNDR